MTKFALIFENSMEEIKNKKILLENTPTLGHVMKFCVINKSVVGIKSRNRDEVLRKNHNQINNREGEWGRERYYSDLAADPKGFQKKKKLLWELFRERERGESFLGILTMSVKFKKKKRVEIATEKFLKWEDR